MSRKTAQKPQSVAQFEGRLSFCERTKTTKTQISFGLLRVKQKNIFMKTK